MHALDAFDRRLLYTMQRSPRQTLTELAERVNLSPSQCSRRLARLEANGIILGHALRLAPEALGLMVTAFISVSVEKSRLGSPRETIDSLLECDEVIDCHSTTGSHDFILKVKVADLAELSHFLSTVVSPIPGIRDVSTQVALECFKEAGPFKVKG
ncbi:Lrp/AsnC family transcriptional regulator [Halomonas sp. SpR1]|uniref:Lrp/AsnC family transcriptional regulator n=1 Tax=Halomonas sp. SpR1 TaxID=3050462 RepID=UPI0027E4B226|nr:Lrp/AsnC family transcriptional regulator [Halomonas sp. SpR1]MDQ7731725.1 Lrp/AsnC family transcriptional regulator [Halomonas sp. SpR1]